MASHRVRGYVDSNWYGHVGGKESVPVSPKKVIDLHGYCMRIQCFTVERLRKNGGPGMESLSELAEFIETLDLTPEEESKIARILEKLRDEATVSA